MHFQNFCILSSTVFFYIVFFCNIFIMLGVPVYFKTKLKMILSSHITKKSLEPFSLFLNVGWKWCFIRSRRLVSFQKNSNIIYNTGCFLRNYIHIDKYVLLLRTISVFLFLPFPLVTHVSSVMQFHFWGFINYEKIQSAYALVPCRA